MANVKSIVDALNRADIDRAKILASQMLEDNQDNTEVLILMAIIHIRSSDTKSAVPYLEKALALKPGNIPLVHQVGSLLIGTSAIRLALKCIRLACKADEENYQYLNSLVRILRKIGRYKIALHYSKMLYAADPGDVSVVTSMALTYHAMKDYKSAKRYYQEALRIDANYPSARINYAILLLEFGQLIGGWNFYAERFSSSSVILPNAHTAQSIEDITNKAIVVICEHSISDCIQFARYISLLKRYANKIYLLCQEKLVMLLQHVEGVDLITSNAKALPPYDIVCPLLNLPKLFNTNIDTIPASTPYLGVEPDKAAYYEKMLMKSKRPWIGFIWAVEDILGTGYLTSQAIRNFKKMISRSEATFLKFQLHEKGDQADSVAQLPNVVDMAASLNQLPDIAALIHNLDLIISVDRGIVHIAGALNIPCWVLLPYNADWRWLLERNDSPWYQSLRLYRMPRVGDAQSVFNQVAEDLKIWLKETYRP